MRHDWVSDETSWQAVIRGNSVKYAFKYACSKYALYLSAYRSNGGQVTFKNFKYWWFIWVTEVDFQTGFDRLFEQSMWRTSMPSQYWTSLSFKEHLLPFQDKKVVPVEPFHPNLSNNWPCNS